jgi:hypothetical protein
MNSRLLRFSTLLAGLLLFGVAVPAADTPATHDAYSDDEIAKAASDFFSGGAKDLWDGIALAPVRFGAGWRQGIALSYMNFSREKRYHPL